MSATSRCERMMSTSTKRKRVSSTRTENTLACASCLYCPFVGSGTLEWYAQRTLRPYCQLLEQISKSFGANSFSESEFVPMRSALLYLNREKCFEIDKSRAISDTTCRNLTLLRIHCWTSQQWHTGRVTISR